MSQDGTPAGSGTFTEFVTNTPFWPTLETEAQKRHGSNADHSRRSRGPALGHWRALEAFALEEYKSDRISKVQLRQMLGLERMELDGFLKAHNVTHDLLTLEEVEQQIAGLKHLGI